MPSLEDAVRYTPDGRRYTLPRDFTPPMQKGRKGTYRACSSCNRFGGEYSVPDDSGGRWMITAPRGTSASNGEPWTCTLCLRRQEGGHAMPDDSTDATHA